MKFVILAQKSKQDPTNYRIFHDEYSGYKPTPVKIGETITTMLDPFPFELWSSLDYDDDHDKYDWANYTPTYLEVETYDIPDSQLFDMTTGNVRSHRFEGMPLTVLREFDEPFQYALTQLEKYDNNLGELTTWLIHEETRNQAEFNAMSQIIDITIARHNKKYGPLDLSFDKYVIPYLPQLLQNDVSFGRYGSIDRDPKTYLMIDNLTTEQLFDFILTVMPYQFGTVYSILKQHPQFGNEFIKELFTNPISANIIAQFRTDRHDNGSEILEDLKQLGVNMTDLVTRTVTYLTEEDFTLSDWADQKPYGDLSLPEIFDNPELDQEFEQAHADWKTKFDEDYAYYQQFENDDDTSEYDNIDWGNDWDDDSTYYYEPEYDPEPLDQRILFLQSLIHDFTPVLTIENLQTILPYVPQRMWKKALED